MPPTGRFAPSPTGALHIGNLRTAALAWLFARASHRAFLLRIEDLDAQRSKPEIADAQLADLTAIGLDFDGAIVRQSERLERYRAALDRLSAAGRTFECYCSRKEIREAQSAPHGEAGRYPGTCRELSTTERARRRRSGRGPTIRLRSDDERREWVDLVRGPQHAVADDVVLCRWDGALAYNLAVVCDDIAQGVDQVVRGDDLVDQTATQIVLTDLLGGAPVEYGHVPLVLNAQHQRLAKRDGAVTLDQLRSADYRPQHVMRLILDSFGEAVPGEADTFADALEGFAPAALPRTPWIFTPPR